MRLYRRVLAVVIVGGLAHIVAAGSSRGQSDANGVRLTLSSQTVWQGEYGWCAFSAQIREGQGGLSYRCGGAGPFGTSSPGADDTAVRQRTLTNSEVSTLRKLYEAARLFDGGHIGADLSASDLPFHILIVRSTSHERRAVVLVPTGNPTFSGGPRRALFDWLIRERQALSR
jgi:hypothetical protein